jgi:hypothetical protein
MDDEIRVDEFHRHELMDRSCFVMHILEMLEDHPAHTEATREKYKQAVQAMYTLYQEAASTAFL